MAYRIQATKAEHLDLQVYDDRVRISFTVQGSEYTHTFERDNLVDSNQDSSDNVQFYLESGSDLYYRANAQHVGSIEVLNPVTNEWHDSAHRNVEEFVRSNHPVTLNYDPSNR